MKVAFVICGQTSRKGFLSNPPDIDSLNSFKNGMFDNLCCDYDVYVVGDTVNVTTNFGSKLKGYVDVSDHVLEKREYYVYNEEQNTGPHKNDKHFQCNYGLFYKLHVAKKMINESGEKYDCIVKLRQDMVLLDRHQDLIKDMLHNPDLQLMSTYDWIHIGKPEIMFKYMSMYTAPEEYRYNSKKYGSFKSTGILPYEDLMKRLQDPCLGDSPEVLLSVIFLEYCIENNLDITKSLFITPCRFYRSGDPGWFHLPSFLKGWENSVYTQLYHGRFKD